MIFYLDNDGLIFSNGQPVITVANEIPQTVANLIIASTVTRLKTAGYDVKDTRQNTCIRCGASITGAGKYCPIHAQERRHEMNRGNFGIAGGRR